MEYFKIFLGKKADAFVYGNGTDDRFNSSGSQNVCGDTGLFEFPDTALIYGGVGVHENEFFILQLRQADGRTAGQPG